MTTDSVTIVSNPTGPTGPAATKADPVPVASGDRPTWLPEKFTSPEDLAKAYTELEKKQGKAPAKEPAPKKETAPKGDTPTNTPESMQQLAKDMEGKGMNFREFYDEYQTSGDLSEESFAKLEAAGYSKEFLSEYIAGQEALAEKVISEVHSVFGGEKEFNAAVQWATANLSAEEVDEINAVVQKGNLAEIKRTFKALKGDMISKRGSAPNLIKGDRSVPGGGYESWAQATKDMKSPEYKKDPAYRAAVERKLAASKF